jgi:hypothetical protein
MGKILKHIIMKKLSALAEANQLLPDAQMGARKNRSIEIALQLLTNQIHTIWGLPDEKRVATMLCMNISGAFDHVSWSRLLHNLHKRQISLVIVQWIESFLNDRITTLKTFKGQSQPFTTTTGIP